MGFELKLVIGWYPSSDDDIASMLEFHQKWGRGIIEIAQFDLSGVDRPISDLYYATAKRADEEFEKDGVRWQLNTNTTVDLDEGDPGAIAGAGAYEVKHDEDRYGKHFYPVELDDFISVLEKAHKASKREYRNETGYWRYNVCLPLLKGIRDSQRYGRMVILLWGH